MHQTHAILSGTRSNRSSRPRRLPVVRGRRTSGSDDLPPPHRTAGDETGNELPAWFIPSPHEGQPLSHQTEVLPDHHALDRAAFDLILADARNGDDLVRSLALIRVIQAIARMTAPQPLDGPLARLSEQVSQAFDRAVQLPASTAADDELFRLLH